MRTRLPHPRAKAARRLSLHLPAGVSCPAVEVPPGQGQARVKATLSASPDVDSSTTRVKAVLRRGQTRLDERTFMLTTRKRGEGRNQGRQAGSFRLVRVADA